MDDDPALRLGLAETLRGLGYKPHEVSCVSEARAILDRSPPHAVLLDLQIGAESGLDLLPDFANAWQETPVLMMTAHSSIETAVEAMRRGAHTYLQKPLNHEELKLVLERACETGKLRTRAEDRRRRRSEQFRFASIVAHSDAMKRVLDQAGRVAESPASTVLLLGESGTGKGLVARAIHYASQRAAAPFLTVTCSAIPEPLLEAELLGHEKGAFTDAKERRRGVFEAADGGSVFLDEIGDMPLALQAKLLGVLEDRSFSRIGSTETVRVDVRIIAATHRDLAHLVEKARFREDLLYRLRVVPIIIPPVRERIADILPLTERFIRHFNSEFGREVEGLAPDAQRALMEHAWPGNVRELRNVIERAMLFAHGNQLRTEDLLLDDGYRPRMTGPAAPAPRPVETAGNNHAEPYSLPAGGVRLDELEKSLILQAMDRAGGNKSRAARILGISRDQIRYRLDKMKK
ncbi:MAG: sigma-54 dependent transcriptional regulator [Planctomycetota bacterium]|nr:sigma-54 dependent transcriptional regulator [Planctomycetota bacterium]